MSRLIVASNRAAPAAEGQGAAGGLVVSVFDAPREASDIQFGRSGETAITVSHEPNTVTKGNIIYATIGLNHKDYDQYYRGFINAMLRPVFHYRVDPSHYERQEYHGYRHVSAQFAHQFKALTQPDDILWVHDYHLISSAAECRALGLTDRIGFFLYIPFPSSEILTTIPPHEDLMRALRAYGLVGFQTEADRVASYDHIEHGIRDYIEQEGQNGPMHTHDRMLYAEVYLIGVHPDKITQQTKASLTRRSPLVRYTSVRGEGVAPQGQS